MYGSARVRSTLLFGLIIALLTVALQAVQADDAVDQVSEVQCRPYIERALKDHQIGTTDGESEEDVTAVTEEDTGTGTSVESKENESKSDDQAEGNTDNGEAVLETVEVDDEPESAEEIDDVTKNDESAEKLELPSTEDKQDSREGESTEEGDSKAAAEEESVEPLKESSEEQVAESIEGGNDQQEDDGDDKSEETTEDAKPDTEEAIEQVEPVEEAIRDSNETKEQEEEAEREEQSEEKNETTEVDEKSKENSTEETGDPNSKEEASTEKSDVERKEDSQEEADTNNPDDNGSNEETVESIDVEDAQVVDHSTEEEKSRETRSAEVKTGSDESKDTNASVEEELQEANEEDKSYEDSAEATPEEELTRQIEIPENLRPREHINQILKLDQNNEVKEAAIQKASDAILKELKRLYDTAIQPLETLYKYRDLSNRHFGDPEIFSKPLVLFMGPWSGGKSSIINYLLDQEYEPTALRTGAEPSPAYFNIVMHGEEEEVLDGTQLAADWTFSGLQKFGEGMLDRLRGQKLPHKLLEKVNIVEIPGILEIRKQVQRLFPFNDACQWFIDRADIIFLVYDPSKLDVGPETEAILDQLKGREYQTRIILNKADQVKPEELMRVQGALIWNISPLMSSAEPPIMYSTSLWSLPYEAGAPTRLLYAQERAFLRDLRSAIDKRVEHKIASARRFAVRVRNHAKMVDCYLTTYYNQKTFFANKKEVSDRIIGNPQNYHIYEGLSTLTNISRYDLPDPDVYRDFFRLNALYDFPSLSSTCTYFRGCPINRLDVAIAYDLPELVGKYKKLIEVTVSVEEQNHSPAS